VVSDAGGGGTDMYFYRPVKKEKVSAGKRVVLREAASGNVYEMDAVELPKHFKGVKIPGEVRDLPGFDLFVQSTSPNRKLEAGQEACFHGEPGARKRGRDEEEEEEEEGTLQSLVMRLWEALPENQRGQEYFAKYNGAPPAALAQQLFELLQGEELGDESSVLGLRPVLHAPVQEIDMWQEEGPDGRKWPFHNRADDFKPENLGKTKFGGVPHLPEMLAHYGRREDFVCQIDCSYLAAFDVRGLLPTTGFLWFWHQLQYMGENTSITRYWNGPRSELQPRVQAEKFAKPVYFVTGMAREQTGAPLFFAAEEDMSDLTEDIGEWTRDPVVGACVTLLCIRNFRESIFSKLPRDIVRMIAKDYLFAVEKHDWSPYVPWGEASKAAPKGPWIPIYFLGPESACGFEQHSCWYGAMIIAVDDAKAGKWHLTSAQGGTD
jgi:hypothetical protein